MIEIKGGNVVVETQVPKLPEATGGKDTKLTISMPDAIQFSNQLENCQNVAQGSEPELGKMPGEFRMAQTDCMIAFLEDTITPLKLATQTKPKAREELQKLLQEKQNALNQSLNLKGREVIRSLRQVPLKGSQDPINILSDIQVIASLLEDDPNAIKDPQILLKKLKDSKKKAIEQLQGKEWPQTNVKYSGQETGSGVKVDVIRHSGFSGVMQYSPEQNAVYIGIAAKPYAEAGNFEDLNIAGLHEYEHAIYMNLSLTQQVNINRAIEQVAKTDPELLQILSDFADELYNVDPNYLSVHAVGSKIGMVEDQSKPGIKDKKIITVGVKDRQSGLENRHQIYMSHMITELFSYATPSQDPALFTRATSSGKRSSELVKIASRFRQKVNSSSMLKSVLDSNGGITNQRPVPQMEQFL